MGVVVVVILWVIDVEVDVVLCVVGVGKPTHRQAKRILRGS